MNQQRPGVLSRLQRYWYHLGGEQPVLTTFWPQDYRPHQVYRVGGQDYRITRYLHAADPRFFEVWGVPANLTAATTTRIRKVMRKANVSDG